MMHFMSIKKTINYYLSEVEKKINLNINLLPLVIVIILNVSYGKEFQNFDASFIMIVKNIYIENVLPSQKPLKKKDIRYGFATHVLILILILIMHYYGKYAHSVSLTYAFLFLIILFHTT